MGGPGIVALGLGQTVACPTQVPGDICHGKDAGCKKTPSTAAYYPFFLPISPLSISLLSLQEGLARAHGCTQLCWSHPKPSMVEPSEADTPCSAQAQHTLRGRNLPTDTLLFIQAINNSHKNPLSYLFVLSQTLPMGKETASILWTAGSRLCIFLIRVIPQVPLFLLFFNSLLVLVPPSQV